VIEPRAADPIRQGAFPVDGNPNWLIRLRWVAVAGQLFTIAIVRFVLHVPVAWGALVTVIALTALSNVVLALEIGGVRIANPRHLAAAMVIDLLALTALLYFSGGPFNPFTVFYFANLALAAAVLPTRWSWGMGVMAITCVATIYLKFVPVESLLHRSGGDMPFDSLYHQGWFVGFAVSALVIVYFITRVRRELFRREQDLRTAQLRQTKSEQLESLATLAAGAGHELASPLSTIAVIAKDLSGHLDGADVPALVLEDVSLIRSELAHCRAILDRMSGFAGEVAGGQVALHTVGEVMQQVMEGVRRRERVVLNGMNEVAEMTMRVPIEGIAQAIRGVVTNAIDASPREKQVIVTASADKGCLVLLVVDRGIGMPDDVLARVGEPFYTTKEVGSGMGLGVFLTNSVLARLGGELILESEVGVGTTATLRLPTSL